MTTHQFYVSGRDTRSFKPGCGYRNRKADARKARGMRLAHDLKVRLFAVRGWLEDDAPSLTVRVNPNPPVAAYADQQVAA